MDRHGGASTSRRPLLGRLRQRHSGCDNQHRDRHRSCRLHSKFLSSFNGAGATPGDAAAVFRACHAEHIAQYPQQRGIAANVDVMLGSIDANRESHDVLPPWQVEAHALFRRETLLQLD